MGIIFFILFIIVPINCFAGFEAIIPYYNSVSGTTYNEVVSCRDAQTTFYSGLELAANARFGGPITNNSGSAQCISRIDFDIFYESAGGDPTGNSYYAEIWTAQTTTSKGKTYVWPAAKQGTSDAIDGSAIPADTPDWVSFYFPSCVTINDATQYVLFIHTSDYTGTEIIDFEFTSGCAGDQWRVGCSEATPDPLSSGAASAYCTSAINPSRALRAVLYVTP